MRTRVLMCQAALIVLTTVYFSPAARAQESQPLTPEEEKALLTTLGVSQANVSTVAGRRFEEFGRAVADVYGTIVETAMGDCVAYLMSADGSLEGDTITWVVADPGHGKIAQVVWLEPDRAGRACTEMLNHPTILLRSPVDEGTLRRIRQEGMALALEAGRQLSNKIPAEQIRTGRITELDVTWLGDLPSNGAYQMLWEIAQCRGIRVSLRASNDGGFDVTSASRIVCSPRPAAFGDGQYTSW